MFSSSEKFDLQKPDKDNGGCRVTTATGFILTFFFIVLAVLVGLIVHFAGNQSQVECTCNCGNGAVTQPSDVTTASPSPLTQCVVWAQAGNGSICNACPQTTTTPATTTAPPSTTTEQVPITTRVYTPVPKVVRDDLLLPRNFEPVHYDLRLRLAFEGNQPFPFNGTVEVYVKCLVPSYNLTIHSAGHILKSLPKLSPLDVNTTAPSVTTFNFDRPREFLVVQFDGPTEAGHEYKLVLEFVGFLNAYSVGFYNGSYVKGNTTRYVAFTQHEATFTRYSFPCFNEPHFKATFNITLERQKADAELYTLANTPLLYTTDLGDGYLADVYQKTVVMSSYLTAWAYVDYTYLEGNTSRGIPVRVFTTKEYINDVNLVLTAAIESMEILEEYCQFLYPMPKIDHIYATPFLQGAMENWGLVTYADDYFHYKENMSSITTFLKVEEVVYHEVVHMWFGNLVTMRWWNDAWLNEAFATYFSYYGRQLVNPGPVYDELFLGQIQQEVMTLDTLPNAIPVREENNYLYTPGAIFIRFDAFIYLKGACLLRMFQFVMGPDSLKKSLQEYLAIKQYQSTDMYDLLAVLNNRLSEDRGEAVDIKDFYETWLFQRNFPYVNMSTTSGQVHLSQGRFITGTPEDGNVQYSWEIPITYALQSSQNFNQSWQNIKWMKKGQNYVTILDPAVSTSDWIIGNIHAHGFYIVNYEDSNWDALKHQLKTDHKVLPVSSRAKILYDAYHLTRSRLLSVHHMLDLLLYMKNETEYLPWSVANTIIKTMDPLIMDEDTYLHLQVFVGELVQERFDGIKMHLGDLRDLRKRQLDHIIFGLACKYYVSDCTQRSSALYNAWRNGGQRIHSDVESEVLCSVVRDGGYAEWKQLYTELIGGTELEKSSLITGLGCSERNSIINRYLSLAITEPKLQPKVVQIIKAVAANPSARAVALKFTIESWELLVNVLKISETDQKGLIEELTSNMSSSWERYQILLWLGVFNKNQNVADAFNTALNVQENNNKWVQEVYPVVRTWLLNNVNVVKK